MNGGINVGGIYADLEVNTAKVKAGMDAGYAAIKAMETELKRLETSLKNGEISQANYAQATGKINASMAEMSGKLQAAAKALGALNAGAQAATTGINNAAAATSKMASMAPAMTASVINATAAVSRMASTAPAMTGSVINAAAAVQKLSSVAPAMTANIINATAAVQKFASVAPAMQANIINAAQATQKFSGMPNMVQANIINPMTKGGDSAKFFGRSMMQAGYMIDDLQYSLLAAVNNVGPFALAMGAGAGVAGSIQIAAVAAAQLHSHWHLIEDAFMSNVTRTQAEEMAILAKNTAKTADEVKRLAEYEKERQDATAIYSQKSKEEEEQAKDAGKAIDKVNGQQTSKTLGALMRLEGGKLPEEEQNAIRREAYKRLPLSANAVEPSFLVSDSDLKRRESQKNQGEFRKQVELVKESHYAEAGSRLLAAAKTDPTALNRLIELVGKSPDSFPAGFLADIKGATPASSKLGDDLTEQGKQNEFWMEQNDRLASQKEAADRKAGVASKRTGKDSAKEDKDRIKEQVKIAKTLMASSSDDAANLYDRVEKGQTDIDSAVGGLQVALEMSGMNKADARSAAIGLLEERQAMDPDARRSDMKRRESAKEADASKIARDKERKFSETRRIAEEAVPGLAGIAEREAAAGILGGGTMDQVAASIAATLREAGLSKEDAAAQAADLAKEGASALYGKANNAAMGKDKKESFSQVFNSDDLRSRVQGGISNKQQEQTDLLKMAVERLTEIVQVSGKTLKIKVD